MSDELIKCGIFWAVPNGPEGGQSAVEFSKSFTVSEANCAGFINYPYSHFEKWEDAGEPLAKLDCYHFPRGRVIFDINRNKHMIYADECVSDEVIDEIVELYKIENYELLCDEHYVCPNCNKAKK